VLIHRIHKGELLVKKGYNYAGLLLNETKFPQDIRNCDKWPRRHRSQGRPAGHQLQERAEPARPAGPAMTASTSPPAWA
jgi:hypothetical protein